MKRDGDFKILVAASDAEIRKNIAEALGAGFGLRAVDSPAHVLEIINAGQCDALFIQAGMSGLSISELLEIVKDKDRRTPVVAVCKCDDLSGRADAMDSGAVAALAYPFDQREAVALAENLKTAMESAEKVYDFVQRQKKRYIDLFGAVDRELDEVLKKIYSLAQSDGPFLIGGGAGAGKGILASILVLSGPDPLRKLESFSVRNKSDTEIEKALFESKSGPGLIKSLPDGAIAIHGIAEMPMRLQDRLLGAIKFHAGRIRFILTTQKDIHGYVLRGEFHKGLWELVEENTVNVPGLKGRESTIEAVSLKMLERYSERMGAPVKSIHPSAMQMLKKYEWPGNLEELERAIAVAVSRAAGSILLPDDLPFIFIAKTSGSIDDLSLEEAIAVKLAPLIETLGDLPKGELYKLVASRLDRPLLKLVLDKFGGNQVKAAAALGIHRNTLRKMLRELSISAKSPKPAT